MSSRVSARAWNNELTPFYLAPPPTKKKKKAKFVRPSSFSGLRWFFLFEDLYNGERSLQANKTSKKQNLNLKQ